jgi:hypothetical protein
MEKNKVNKFLLILPLLLLMGCEPAAKNVDSNFSVRPKHLQNCRIDKLQNDSGSRITVVYCPNATVTTQLQDKALTTTTTIAEAQYENSDTYLPQEDTIVVNGKEYIRKSQ